MNRKLMCMGVSFVIAGGLGALLPGCATALPGQEQADAIKLVVQPERLDAPPVDVRIEAPVLAGAERQGTAIIALSPNVATGALGVTVGVAGSIDVVEPPPGFRAVTREVPPVVKDLPFKRHLDGELPALQAGDARTIPLRLRVSGSGYGLVAVGVQSPPRVEPGAPVQVSESFVLYVLVRDARVYFSAHSILDLDLQELREQLEKQGLSPQEIEEALAKRRRAGAKVQSSVSAPDPGTHRSITVAGQVLFTDINGNTHPVTFANVEVWDEEAGPDDLVTTTTTDGSGNYSVSVDDNDGDGSGRDIFVIVLAQGSTVSVEDFANAGSAWSVDSLPAVVDVPDFTTVTLNVTAGNDVANSNQVAFEAYEAANSVSRFLPAVGGSLPSVCILSFPGPGDGSSYWPPSATVTLAGTDVHDWDNIQHEYDHHVQNEFNLADSPGGGHSLGEDLCSTHGKDDGLRLAWGEAWATFFAVMAQAELGHAALGIPNLGDTSYTDTKPVGAPLTYDLEPNDGLFLGESDEVVNQRLLWDLYDPADDGGDAGVAETPAVLWAAVADNLTHTLSECWQALVFGRTEAQKASFGRIAEDHGVGTTLTAPADGTTYAGGAVPAFTWTPNLECDTGGNGQFSVRYYTPGFTALIWASPWQGAASLTPTNTQRDNIFVGPDAALPWLVASRDTTAPQTGPYYGDSRTINDDFDVPDRGPVDLMLVLDVSDSMNSPVPGGSFGLTKIALLRQAVEVFLRTWSVHAIAGDRIGIVFFSTDTSTVSASPPMLLDMTSAATVDAIVAEVSAESASGCTAMGGGLQVALDSFDAGSTSKRVIILFTDGMQSTNPFVGEEGTPARLKIKTFASGSSLPFGAFFCDTGTAEAPDGSAIVPDGQFLDDHSLQVHTIGVGVDGDSFETLIERVADETAALHHFTSAPDEELDLFYTNDLVGSLKTATLEVVETDADTLAQKKEARKLSVPVNDAAISLTLVLSWKGVLQKDAVTMTVVAPGALTAPVEVREGEFFRIEKYDLDGFTDGSWSVVLTSQSSGPVGYQFTAILDEPCFHYDFGFPRADYVTGDRIPFTVALTADTRPVSEKAQVWVDVSMPRQPIGNLLAGWLPRVEPMGEKLGDVEEARVPFVSRLMAAFRDPAFVKLLRARTVQSVQLFDSGEKLHGDARAGDGIFSGLLEATRVPGNYRLGLRIDASTPCGRVHREESTSLLVSLARLDPDHSKVTVLPLGESTYALLVAPADRFGNLLGPGHAADIDVCVKGEASLEGGVRDRFDGSYEQKLMMKEGVEPLLTISVAGQQLFHARFGDLLADGQRRLSVPPSGAPRK